MKQFFPVRQIQIRPDRNCLKRRRELQHPNHVAHASGQRGREMKSRVERDPASVKTLHASADHTAFFQQQNTETAVGKQQTDRHSGHAAADHQIIKLLIQQHSPI